MAMTINSFKTKLEEHAKKMGMFFGLVSAGP